MKYWSLQIFVEDADGCEKDGSPAVVSVTADWKKPLNKDTLELCDSLIERMLGVVTNILHSMNNTSLHNDL